MVLLLFFGIFAGFCRRSKVFDFWMWLNFGQIFVSAVEVFFQVSDVDFGVVF